MENNDDKKVTVTLVGFGDCGMYDVRVGDDGCFIVPEQYVEIAKALLSGSQSTKMH